MKITLTEDLPGLGDQPKTNTVTVERDGDGGIEDVFMLFKSALIGLGYHPDTVRDAFEAEAGANEN